ncbi:MAG: exonuclease domain-containing protein [Thermaerobacter sp.]|nr:exonuclease domain-containing protein [Thermaerobacter sp.]
MPRHAPGERVEPTGPYVVLDLETTGLDPARDRIIQIAIRHSDGRGWDSFVNPERGVPLAIRQLTGFEGVDFSQAPRLVELKPMLLEYLQNARWVGHNIHFDAAFLARVGITAPGEPLDTLEWGRLAFPLRGHYSLADWFDPSDQNLHDARVDARLTEQLLHQIRERLSRFSSDLKRDLSRFLGGEWDWWAIPPDGGTAVSALYRPGPDQFEPKPLTVEPIAESPSDRLGSEGALARSTDGFEVRPGQLRMAEAVERAFEQENILLVQAGTGTGKSLAYLTPAIIKSLSDGTRTVIATHTVALQEQLWLKDLPQAKGGWPLEAALVKGRGRYLCLLKAQEVVQESAVLTESRERRWALATLLCYIEATEVGDAEEFPIKNEQGRALWSEVMADSHSCAGSRCPYAGPCFMRSARHQAESSHLVVVNHALLAAHIANGGVLPEFSHLVIDEAHHFAEVMESSLGFELDGEDFDRRYREVMHPGRGVFERLAVSGELSGQVQAVRSGYRDLARILKEVGQRLVALTPAGEYDRRSVRLTADLYDLLTEQGILNEWRDIVQTFQALTDKTAELWEEAEARGSADTPIWLRFRQWQQDLVDAAVGMDSWGKLSSERVSWWEVRTGRQGEPVVTWRWAPVDIAPIIEEKLWSRLRAAVLTSATLAVHGRFDYTAGALGIPHARRVGLQVPSPFDWDRQARLFIPTDSPDPNEPEYLDALAEVVKTAALARGGHTLVLLTSYRAVQGMAWRLRPVLQDRQIRTMAHGIDGAPRQLVAEFRHNPAAVLIGTLTFWEGVDIPGDDLEVVVMGRLPFRAPGDPLEEAKLERIRAQGYSPFYRRSLPQAVLRFQQGFGRLIRSESDRGIVIVCDPRIKPDRSRYGQLFLDAIRDVPREMVPSERLGERIDQFWRDDAIAHPY